MKRAVLPFLGFMLGCCLFSGLDALVSWRAWALAASWAVCVALFDSFYDKYK